MDHHQFDEEVLRKGTAAILKTRDGKLRAAVPSPLGSCVFLNDVEADEMNAALRRHKALMREYPRNGEGLEAYVDASDTGYTELDTASTKVGATNGSGPPAHSASSNGTNGTHHDTAAAVDANGLNGLAKKSLNNGVTVRNGVDGGSTTNGLHV